MSRISGAYRWRYKDGAGLERIEYGTFSEFVSANIEVPVYATYFMLRDIHESMQSLKLDSSTDLLECELLDFSVEHMN